MPSIYDVRWTENAEIELEDTILYLEMNFGIKEIRNLMQSISKISNIISDNPFTYPIVYKDSIRRAVVMNYNSMFYRVNRDSVDVLSFFSNRQSSDKLDF